MSRIPNFRNLLSYMTVLILSAGIMLTLNSCFHNPEEPEIIVPDEPGDDPNEDPNDNPNVEPDDKPTDDPSEDPSGNELTDNIKNTLAKGDNLSAKAVVTGRCTRGLILTDNAGSILYYNTSVKLEDYPLGTVVNINGQLDAYNRALELTSNATIEKDGTFTYSYPEPISYDGTMIDAACKETSNMLASYITVTGVLNISDQGSYKNYNVNVDGAACQVSFYYLLNDLETTVSDGAKYKIDGYFVAVSSGKYFNVLVTNLTKLEDGSGNSQDVDPSVTLPSIFTNEPYGYVVLPESIPQQYKAYTGFNLSFNKDNHTPNYVAWELTASEANGSVETTRNYWQDSEITGCAPVQDGWSAAGYDRGHMCPAADQKWSKQAMDDCAVMANMCPQTNALNAGGWATLEGKERAWAKKYGAVWIVCGPIYSSDNNKFVGNAKTRVPDAFFKAILYENGNNSKAVGFIYPHSATPGSHLNYAVSIDELEEETGYDFFSALPDEIENKIESSFNNSDWQ